MIILGYMITLFFTLLCLGTCVLRQECANRRPLMEPTYKLFGTKTSYDEAVRYMESKNPSDLPKSYSHKSLRQMHNDMMTKDCAPVHMYFVGRHAARFPDKEDIEALNQFYETFKIKLEQQQYDTVKCDNDANIRQQLLSWRTPMRPQHDNLLTYKGEIEEAEIANRFQSLYPKLFDLRVTNITVGVTGKIRTTQTAVAFLRAIKDFNYPKCNYFPTNDLNNSSYTIEGILRSECYKALEDKYKLDSLEFHDQCKKIRKSSSSISQKDELATKVPLVKKFDRPEDFQFIANSIRDKLRLDSLTSDEMQMMYDICKYEYSLKGSSVWCSLFEDRHLMYLDYSGDIEDYIEDAYGLELFAQQTCPLVKDLIMSFEKTIKSNSKHGQDSLNSNFYFSHAGVLKKLFAAFKLFEDRKNYNERMFEEVLRTKSPPLAREWRSSLTIPFSGNIAFHLYKCPENKFKLLTSVDEKPVKIGGCKHKVCDVSEFMETYRSNLKCNLNEVCSYSP